MGEYGRVKRQFKFSTISPDETGITFKNPMPAPPCGAAPGKEYYSAWLTDLPTFTFTIVPQFVEDEVWFLNLFVTNSNTVFSCALADEEYNDELHRETADSCFPRITVERFS